MALPGSYTSSLQLKVENIDIHHYIKRFEHVLQRNDLIKNFKKLADKIEFTHQSLFGIHYQVEIDMQKGKPHNLEYDIKLNKLIQVCIVLVLFIAFFSSFRFNGFLWFSAIFTLIFYGLNIFVIDRYVQHMIKSALFKNLLDVNEENLGSEQLEWINDKSKCPGCGEDITEFDLNCPDCGLKLRENAVQAPYNASKYGEKRIRYYFKEEKKSD